MTGPERAAIIDACKFTRNMVPDTPYTCTEELLDKLNCQFYAHGDDPCYGADGENFCEVLTKKERFKEFKRTPGVSTTDITAKLLKLIAPGCNE